MWSPKAADHRKRPSASPEPGKKAPGEGLTPQKFQLKTGIAFPIQKAARTREQDALSPQHPGGGQRLPLLVCGDIESNPGTFPAQTRLLCPARGTLPVPSGPTEDYQLHHTSFWRLQAGLGQPLRNRTHLLHHGSLNCPISDATTSTLSVKVC